MSNSHPKGSLDKSGGFVPHLKRVHSFNDQVRPLRDYVNELLKLINEYREPRKRQAFLDHIQNAILDHGNTGLKKHRSLFIQGVKVLGGDKPDFSGFELDKDGFPRHYGDIFRLLAKYRYDDEKKTVKPGPLSKDTGLREEIFVVDLYPHIPSRYEAEKISTLLSILRWPYSIRLEHSKQAKTELLRQFCVDIVDPGVATSYPALRLGEAVADNLRPFFPAGINQPLSFNPSNRTYKGGNPNSRSDRRLPAAVGYACLNDVRSSWMYGGPVGKVSVLSERAGKTRFITSYDGAINSSDLYEKARSILDNIREDASFDQRRGHEKLKRLTSENASTGLTGNKIGQMPIISADLDNFTDRLHFNAYRDLLNLIGAHDFMSIGFSPIKVGSETVNPMHFLMGLKGTFELASLVHHGIVRMILSEGITCQNITEKRSTGKCDKHTGHAIYSDVLVDRLWDYSLCGDDLLFRSRNGLDSFLRYEKLCSYAGLSLNKMKTVISIDTGVFCGKVFFRGIDVSPVTPPLFTFSSSYEQFVSAAGNFVHSSKRLGSAFTRRAVGLVKAYGKLFRGRFIPYALPFKLGGIGVNESTGLICLLSKIKYRLCCKVPDEFPKPPPEMVTVRYPHHPIKEIRVLPHTWNLLVSGSTKRFRKAKIVSAKPVLKDMLTVLCYFYGIPSTP